MDNFRDFGGYRGFGGGYLRRAMLWRSAHHAGASLADLATIAGLQLATVCDLRSRAERASDPFYPPPPSAADIIRLHYGPATARAGRTEMPDTRAAMLKIYGGIAFRPQQIELMRRWFAAMAGGAGSTLIHGTTGHHRTGIAAALLLLALGVHADDVMADYLIIGSDTADTPPVDADYLHHALTAIRTRHGAIEAYLESELKCDVRLRARLRHHIIT